MTSLPIPVFALLAFVGLLFYAAIGAVVGALMVRIFGRDESHYRHSHLRGIAGAPNGDGDAWQGFIPAAIGWPLIVALTLVGGVLAAVLVLPIVVARSVGRYSARAVLPAEIKAEMQP